MLACVAVRFDLLHLKNIPKNNPHPETIAAANPNSQYPQANMEVSKEPPYFQIVTKQNPAENLIYLEGSKKELLNLGNCDRSMKK